MYENQNLEGGPGRPPPPLESGPGPVGPWVLGVYSFRGNLEQLFLWKSSIYEELQSSEAINESARAL